MGRFRYSQPLLNVVYLLSVFCVVGFRPLVAGSCVKLVSSLLLAFVLAFVVVESPKIYELLTACLQDLPIAVVPVLVDRRWVACSQTSTRVPNEPTLCSLFRRPPPIFLL
jgi:hypothetical protein